MKPDSPKKTAKKTARTPDSGKSSTPSKRPAPSAAAAKAAPKATSGSAPAQPEAKPAAKSTTKSFAQSAAKAPARTSPPAPTAAPAIPSLLLEGDEPSTPRPSGPGERYALGPIPPVPSSIEEPSDLPESYGTQKLYLTARDPQWLHAHWDFSSEQLRRYNARSADRHLVLRVFKDEVKGEPHREVHVHPESRSWFVNVAQASTRYLAQLGYYQAERGTWVALSTSGATLTPADTLSADLSVWFETLPVEVRFEQLLRLVRQAIQDSVPLMEALQQLRTLGYPGLPDTTTAKAGSWTPAQEKALAEVVTLDSVRRVWMGSLEITELIRRQFLQELSSQAAAALGETSSWSSAPSAVSSLSSPYGGAGERPKGFWFNVNAELIIYGATEPDAAVTIGGRTIRLRPDGTFSYRFVLPDGRYQLPAVATSADGSDSRSAALEFSRSTEYRGEVHAHPQDPAMPPPRVEHVS